MSMCLGQAPFALCGLHKRQPALAFLGFFRLWCMFLSGLNRCAPMAHGHDRAGCLAIFVHRRTMRSNTRQSQGGALLA